MQTFLATLLCLFQTAFASFTVSGFSSGGFMAVQMHVAFSSDVTGAGVIAGGPYYCAQGSIPTGRTACLTDPEQLHITPLISYTDQQAASGKIDSTSNLQFSKVWIYSGRLDSFVRPDVVRVLVRYYQNYVIASNIATEFNIRSEHGWITENYGVPCDVWESPYLNNCGYDAAGVLLQQLYGTLNPKGTQVSGNLITFDQMKFASPEAQMLTQGYIYIPTSCQSDLSVCKVHVAFHGCTMNSDLIGTQFVINSGLNEWAETNYLVVLYPQGNSRTGYLHGCWDYLGLTGPNYALKSGLQMEAVHQMAMQVPESGIETWSSR